jgi:hypothetical protein
MNYSLIIWIVFGVISALVVLFTVIFCFRRTGLQSFIRLLFLLAAAVIAVFATLAVTSYAVDYATAYLSGVATAEEMRQLVAAAIAPICFLAVFIVVNLVLFIIYAIVGACSFSQGHHKRKERRLGRVYHTGKISRAFSLLFNFVICFSIASMLLVPVTYYVPLAYTVATNYSATTTSQSTSDVTDGVIKVDAQVAESANTAQMTDVLKAITENPFYHLYAVEGDLVTKKVTTMDANGEQTTLKEFVDVAIPVVNEITDLSSGDVSPEKLYNVAGDIKSNGFLDKLLGGVLSDAAKEWKQGKSFLGIAPPDLQSQALSQSVYAVLAQQDTVSDSLYAVGHIYALSNVLNVTSLGSGSSADALNALANNLTLDSMNIVKNLLSDTVIEELGLKENQSATKITGAVNGIMEGLYKVKNTDSEKLATETAAIATVFDAVQNASTMDAETADDMVGALKESEVLQDVLKDMVEDNANPLQVEVADGTEDTIKTALADNDVQEDSELYNTVMQLFGI